MKSSASYQMRGKSSPRRKPGEDVDSKHFSPTLGGRKTEIILAGEPPALQIAEHALSSPEREVCGFIYRDHYVPLTNIAANPRSFVADPAEVAKALAQYGEPEAIFHSHPDGSTVPSAEDLQLASYYSNSMILIGKIVERRLELFQVVAPPQLDPEPAVQP